MSQGIAICAVCHGDRSKCQHTEDEWYDALIAENQRHLNAFGDAYRRLYEWHKKFRKDRRAMKERITELEAKNRKLEKRLQEYIAASSTG